MKKTVLLSGSSNRPLSLKTAKLLGIKLGRAELEEFPNREIRIRILEEVKDKTVFILQSTGSLAEHHIIELALLADAAKRKGAKKIIAIMPWFGYAPQDKVFRLGEPLSSKVIVTILESAPINEFAVVDIHSKNVLTMFTKKVHHLSAMPVFIDYFNGKLKGKWCSVALDNGARDRAFQFAQKLNLPLIKFDKSRDRKTGEVTFHKLSGDVQGKNVISFDDFVSTGGTRIQGSAFLKSQGAKKYFDCVTHLIVPETTKKFENSSIDKIFITDSILLDSSFKVNKLKTLSIAPILKDFIKGYE